MTTTQRGLAAACCLASAALAALLPGALHHPSSVHDTAASLPVHAAHPTGAHPSAAAVVGAASVTVPTRSASIGGVPVGQSVTTAPDALPAPVDGLALVSNTWTSGTLTWSGSSPYYRVQVDGVTVRSDSPDTSITLTWPRDGHRLLVRVAGVDVHGTHGTWTSVAVQPLAAGSSQPSSSPASVAPISTSTAPSAPVSSPTTPSSATPTASAQPVSSSQGAADLGDTHQDAGTRQPGTRTSAAATSATNPQA